MEHGDLERLGGVAYRADNPDDQAQGWDFLHPLRRQQYMRIAAALVQHIHGGGGAVPAPAPPPNPTAERSALLEVQAAVEAAIAWAQRQDPTDATALVGMIAQLGAIPGIQAPQPGQASQFTPPAPEPEAPVALTAEPPVSEPEAPAENISEGHESAPEATDPAPPSQT